MLILLSRFKVSGHSMMPALKPNQEILVSGLPFLFFKPQIGDVVAFKDKEKFAVKRIKEIKGNGYYVQGDNKRDSKDYGLVKREEIIGKLIYILSR